MNDIVPEYKPVVVVKLAYLSIAAFVALVLFIGSWVVWGFVTAFLLMLVEVGIAGGWLFFRHIHLHFHHTRHLNLEHKEREHAMEIAKAALKAGHSLQLEYPSGHKVITTSPLTIPNGPVTVKELNVGNSEPLALPAPLPIAPAFWQIEPLIAPGHLFLGQSAQGPLWGDIIDLLSTLIAGRPGQGKSTLLRGVCGQVLRIGGLPVIFDPHGSIVDDLGTSFQCAESAQDIDDRSQWLLDHLDKRLAFRRAGKREFKPLLLLVDEIPVVCSMSENALKAIRRIVLEGRKIGMFALVSGQGVPASILGGTLVRDAMSSRYVFLTTPQQARMAGIENETAKQMISMLEAAGDLSTGKAILATLANKPQIVAIPNTTTEDIRRLVARNAIGKIPERENISEPFRNGEERLTEELYEDAVIVPEKEAATLTSISPEEREQIIRLAKVGVLRRDICLALGKGKYYYEVVKQVLDESGL